MNSITRKKQYGVLSIKYGEYCQRCQKLRHEVNQLVIHHKDNNNCNNSPDNLVLLCRRCNYLMNPRPVDECEREEESGDESELQNSKKNEPIFRGYVYHRINENNNTPIPEKELLNGGAEHVGNSPTTCQRYLNKMCSSEGPLRRWRSAKTIVVGYKGEQSLI